MSLLLLLVSGGALAATVLAPRLDAVGPRRVARAYLGAVAATIGLRILAYVAAHVFGVQPLRPWSTGPGDLTNVLIGALYGVTLARGRQPQWQPFFEAPELLLALRIATGMAFVLAGLVNVFLPDLGVSFFVEAGYSKTFRLFILTAEVLGGAALLLPWRWLGLAAAAGLTVDMAGAILTQLRVGESAGELGPALTMLLRLAPLVLVLLTGVSRRWWILLIGVVACTAVAFLGSGLLRG